MLQNLAGKLAPPLRAKGSRKSYKRFGKFVRSGIPKVDRTNFYEQILDNLNTNKLSATDVDYILSEFNSSAISLDVKKYLAKMLQKVH